MGPGFRHGTSPWAEAPVGRPTSSHALSRANRSRAAGGFRCFGGALSASWGPFSAEILGQCRLGQLRNSENSRCSVAVFRGSVRGRSAKMSPASELRAATLVAQHPSEKCRSAALIKGVKPTPSQIPPAYRIPIRRGSGRSRRPSVRRHRARRICQNAIAWRLICFQSAKPISSVAGSTSLLASLERAPGFPMTYRVLASCYAHMGRLDEAREIVGRLRAITSVVMERGTRYRTPEHRELFLSGLRLAAGEAI